MFCKNITNIKVHEDNFSMKEMNTKLNMFCCYMKYRVRSKGTFINIVTPKKKRTIDEKCQISKKDN